MVNCCGHDLSGNLVTYNVRADSPHLSPPTVRGPPATSSPADGAGGAESCYALGSNATRGRAVRGRYGDAAGDAAIGLGASHKAPGGGASSGGSRKAALPAALAAYSVEQSPGREDDEGSDRSSAEACAGSTTTPPLTQRCSPGSARILPPAAALSLSVLNKSRGGKSSICFAP